MLCPKIGGLQSVHITIQEQFKIIIMKRSIVFSLVVLFAMSFWTPAVSNVKLPTMYLAKECKDSGGIVVIVQGYSELTIAPTSSEHGEVTISVTWNGGSETGTVNYPQTFIVLSEGKSPGFYTVTATSESGEVQSETFWWEF